MFAIFVFLPYRLHALAADTPREQYEVARAYEGRGFWNDGATAAKWYERAAAGGHSYAQLRIGEIYFSGIGVPVDEEKAHFWFRAAEKNGKTSHMLTRLRSGESPASVRRGRPPDQWE